jgi:transposase
VETLDARGATAVIPPKSNRKQRRDYDEDAYAWRHLMENYFAKIKEFRALATRYENTASSYAANWHLAATIIAGR